jgi:putative peptidoglycan lipid II flippase
MGDPNAQCTEPDTHLARNSMIVGAATVLARLLGFARDILIARALGAGPVADAFLVAFRLPNLFRRVLGEGGLNAPFVPLYVKLGREQSPQAASRFAGEALGFFSIVLMVLIGLTEIIAPWLVLGLAGGFRDAPVTQGLAETYTRLVLPFLAFTVLASLISAILNAEKRFAIAALAPLALNLTLLALLALGDWHQIDGAAMARILAIGVTAGGVIHLAIVSFALSGGPPGWPRPSLSWSPDMTRLLVLAVPSLIAASTAQLVLLVATQIASVQPGAVSWLYYADRVFQLPLGFVAVAMGVVLLPEIARREAEGDVGGRRQTVDRALVLGLAIAIPAAAALVVIAGPIVAVLFERGHFTATDSKRTAEALAAFAPGMPMAVAAKVFAQVFFARATPRGPLIAGLASLVVAAVVGYHLAPERPASGAAAAASLAFLVQGLILALWLMASGLWQPTAWLLRKVLAILLASSAMVAMLMWLGDILDPALGLESPQMLRVAALAALCGGGLATYGVVAMMLGLIRRAGLAPNR